MNELNTLTACIIKEKDKVRLRKLYTRGPLHQRKFLCFSTEVYSPIEEKWYTMKTNYTEQAALNTFNAMSKEYNR